MNRTRAFFSRDRVKRLERRLARLDALRRETRYELELAYEASEEASGIPYIRVRLGDEIRVGFIHEKTFDDSPECDKPGVVVPIRGK